MEAVFALRNVSKSFGDLQVLVDVDLEIWPGERVALIGPSGAGKSTLINLLNGTFAPSSGEVRVLGQNLAQLAPRMRRAVQQQIGTIYQQFSLVDSLRVINNVNAGHLGRWSLAKALLSLVWPQDTATAAYALARVGIAEKLYARTHDLSGGQQQRVAIARVLVQNPRAILADEPISSLDPESSREIIDLLCDLCVEAGKTLLTSLHRVEVARSHFERMVGLRAGRILFDCRADLVTPEMIAALYALEWAGDDALSQTYPVVRT